MAHFRRWPTITPVTSSLRHVCSERR
jgi:hypothetical protein